MYVKWYFCSWFNELTSRLSILANCGCSRHQSDTLTRAILSRDALYINIDSSEYGVMPLTTSFLPLTLSGVRALDLNHEMLHNSWITRLRRNAIQRFSITTVMLLQMLSDYM
jgi:hypothetical protein